MTAFLPGDAERWDEQWSGGPALGDIEVEVTEPEVLGVIYGPDGKVAFTLLDRPVQPFGFQRP